MYVADGDEPFLAASAGGAPCRDKAGRQIPVVALTPNSDR